MPEMELLARFSDYVIEPAMYILFAAGFFMFVWGLVQFLWNLQDGKDHEAGLSHMRWGIVGMFVMMSFIGILMLISNTFNLGLEGNPDGTYRYNVDVGRAESFRIDFGL